MLRADRYLMHCLALRSSFFRPVIQTTQTESKSGNLLADRDEDVDLVWQHFGLQKTLWTSLS
jgi:hypothetical protein